MIEIAHDVNFVKVKAIDTMVKMVFVVLCSVLQHLFLLLFFAVVFGCVGCFVVVVARRLMMSAEWEKLPLIIYSWTSKNDSRFTRPNR
jgi:hypothetical protein